MTVATKLARVLAWTILCVALIPFGAADSGQAISKAQLISSQHEKIKEIEKEVFVARLLNQVSQVIVDTPKSNFIPKVTRKSADTLEIELVDPFAKEASEEGTFLVLKTKH
ncbi:hypothetical protein JCM33374_g887 [Metschnikowia sp. JCM 33374]|nr:hypothetical protein JCM33374_g887 [Metschnikowia sp. JCM 33374]